MKKYASEVERFIKTCYTKEVKNYSNLMLYSGRANLRKSCAKRVPKVVSDLMQGAPCINRYVQKNDTCLIKFINKSAQLINIDDDKKKIPHLCWYDCSFNISMF